MCGVGGGGNYCIYINIFLFKVVLGDNASVVMIMLNSGSTKLSHVKVGFIL